MSTIDNSINNNVIKSANSHFSGKSTNFGSDDISPKTDSLATNPTEIRDTFLKAKKSNGLFEKFYDYCKNITGFGLGSKKLAQKIAGYENGQISEEEAKKNLSDYSASQENSAQNFGNLASGVVAVGGYYKLANVVKKLKARLELNAMGILSSKALDQPLLKFKNFVKSPIKTNAAIIPLVMLAGGLTKWIMLKFNRTGSKEFKVDNKEQLDKTESKKAKKELNRARHKLNFKNFYTGALNGLLAPVTAIAGGIVGVPLYVLSVFGIKSLTGKKGDKDKPSTTNYIETLKNNVVLEGLFAAALAIPLLGKARFSKVLDENLAKVVKKLKDVKLKQPDLPANKTAYEELEDIMLGSPKIKHILNSSSDVNAVINKLTEENIFAVKFMQISNRGGALSSALIENCPPSRTMKEAQQEINKLISSNKYQVTKLLGVGTVAESYLAKDASGREVCIKILKKGITGEKIQRDKEAFIHLITNGAPKEKLTQSQQYLIKNVENLSEGISREVDFVNEMEAAKKLHKSTKLADVVVPIEAKPGIYVMEKAPGISLDTLVKYYQYETQLTMLKKYGEKVYKREIDSLSAKITELKAKSPDFKDFDLSEGEIKKLLHKYIDVMTEQLAKVDKNGKTLHADIHPGNIFIDLEVLKGGKKGKLFTLIDTGNTIDLTKEQAMSAIKFISFIKNGNVPSIAKYVLDGAALPAGMTQEQAIKLVEEDLKKIFFDGQTKINSMNIDEVFKLTNNILRKHNIIPNDTQLNLNKAKKSAETSLKGLVQSFFGKKFANMDFKNGNKTATIATITKDIAIFMAKFKQAKTLRETKNLFQMTFSEIINSFRNPTKLKTNSEEYLTYKFKQNMDMTEEIGAIK